jgi:signal peptidase I
MENTGEKNNPRKAMPAFLLSLLVPGLGHLYNGQLKKALFFPLGLIIYVISINIFGLVIYFWLYVLAATILILLQLFIAVNASLTAYKNKEYELKPYNKWYVYFFSAIIWLLVSFVVKGISNETRYRILTIGSDAGYPNISTGYRVLGDFNVYNSQEPTYGDLVIFSMPDGVNYVFRIIGIPNDTLSVENQLVKYKNKKLSSKLVSTLFYEECEMDVFIETLPNGVKYKFIRSKNAFLQDNDTFKEIVVPDNSYFLLGDNRDISIDSRFIGFIKREQIRGKLLSIYFSKDFKVINKRFFELVV